MNRSILQKQHLVRGISLFALACTGMAAQPNDDPRAPTHPEIQYGQHAMNYLDFWQAESGSSAPLVIFIHGGGFRKGDKSIDPASKGRQKPGFRESMYDALNEAGFAIASINYRLPMAQGDQTDEVSRLQQIRDTKAAIRHLRANADKYPFNPERIGVWGTSAGGGLCNLAGTAGDHKPFDDYGFTRTGSSKVQAVVSFFGPTFHRMPGETNVLQYATADDPPFLLVHGEKDKTVPVENSIVLRDALAKCGHVEGEDVVLVVAKGLGHGLGAKFDDYIPVAIEFLKRHLGSARPSQ